MNSMIHQPERQAEAKDSFGRQPQCFQQLTTANLKHYRANDLLLKLALTVNARLILIIGNFRLFIKNWDRKNVG